MKRKEANKKAAPPAAKVPHLAPDAHPRNDADIDHTIEDSFPASDPPAWSGSSSSASNEDQN